MSPALTRFRLPLLVIGGILLWLGSVHSPVAPATGLDASWQQVLGYAREQRFALGRDIVFTYGPWGWLTTAYCHPSQYWPRLAWELILNGTLACGWVFVSMHLSWWRSVALLAFGLFLLPFFTDTTYVALVVGVLIWLGTQRGHHPITVTVLGSCLGFLAMQKFTLFVMTGAGAGGICLCLWLRRERRPAIILTIAWFAGLIGSWLMAGQSLKSFAPFLQNSFAVASAYQEAMSFQEKIWIFWLGISCALLTAALILSVAARSKGTWLARAALAATCFGLGYLVWKHGFVRADGHVLGFFYCTLIAALLVPRLLVISLPLAVVSLAGIYWAIPALVKNAPAYAWLHVCEGAATVFHPVAQHESFLTRTMAARKAADLPVARSLIGNASVDVLGYEQSIALLNQFNYRPRPIFQGYQACSPALAALNAAYFASPAAPEFVLARMESIDQRLPALDDARLLPLLLTHYRVAGEDNGLLVLQRKNLPVLTGPEEGRTINARLKEPIFVPPSATPLWMTIKVDASMPGRLRAFFYKPAEMRIRVVLDSGETKDFRFNPSAASGGFLITPFLPDTETLKKWFSTRIMSQIRSVTITPARRCTWFFKQEIEVRFSPLPIPAQ